MGEENKNPVEAKAEETTQENEAQSTVNAQQASENIANAVNNFNNTTDTTGDYDSSDIEENKIFAILAYIGILWLVGLLAAKDSKFARFHVNQGIVLFIAALLSVIPIIGWIWSMVVFVFAIIGIVNAATGKAKELPLIGGIRIIK